jgi:hypothetical protein
MASPGRPTLYKADYAEQAHAHCLLGATNAGLAELFEVAPRTIDYWIANIPEFATAVREGRAVADARVARSLYERAVGYSRTIEQTALHRGEERKLVNTVHYPPDTGACIFWLRNRQPRYWSSRGRDEPGGLTEEMLAELDAAGERAAAARDGR